MKNVSSLDACKAQCAARSDCVAVDYFTTTNWCNFYQKACNSPTDSHEGASSYRIQGLPCDARPDPLRSHTTQLVRL